MERKIEDNFLKEYLRYTRGQESPEMFHIWVALVMIAAALDRKVKLERGYYDLFPNLYVVLVAGTAKCHKTAAIKIGVKRILSKIKDSPDVFAQKITNERIIQFLAEGSGQVEENEDDDKGIKLSFKASGIIAAEELSSFLGKNAMDTGIITTLTDFYDCQDKWSYETKSSGKDELENIYINLIGASTGKWLRSAIPEEAVGGGFISRTIFIYQDQPRKLIAHPELEIPDNIDEIEENLIHDLEIISDLEGVFGWSDEAREWYTNWYEEDAKRNYQDVDADFFTRMPQWIIKVAMLVSVARDNELVIRMQDLKQAKAYLDAVKASMTPVIHTMTTAESELPTKKVLGVIKRRGEITHRRLTAYTKRFVKAEGLKKIIETLQESGEIETEAEGNTWTYKYIGED